MQSEDGVINCLRSFAFTWCVSAFRRIKWSATIGGRRPFGMDHMVCDEDKGKVTDFYESDEMSRLCSGSEKSTAYSRARAT